MASKKCSECGAELRLRPHRCPLCGADMQEPAAAAKQPETVDVYQADVRSLRDQLKKLRDEGAEAV